MASPANQVTPRWVIPPGEAQKSYAPSDLAWEVLNFQRTTEGSLKSINGPVPYEIQRSPTETTTSTYTTTLGSVTPHLCFHTMLQGGLHDLLLVRSGNTLYRHAGWYRGWEILLAGLLTEARESYPDQALVFNDRVIWTNGVDQAQVISADGMVVPLGLAEAPGTPTVRSPALTQDILTYPNMEGYSWPGRIGTMAADSNGRAGSILPGSWRYAIKYEDIHGNLSAPSPLSGLAQLSAADADPYTPPRKIFRDGISGVTTHIVNSDLADLTRQFAIELPEAALPTHVVAVHVYRTADLVRSDSAPRFVARLPGQVSIFPDNFADSELGDEMGSGIPVPVFRVMCSHQGRLVIGNTIGDPGIVRRSVPGFPGQFTAEDFVYPDPGGAEVTAVIAHAGVLIAFTENSVFSLEDFASPRPLAQGVGCVAPRSVAALPDGSLIWLARDGFYSMRLSTEGSYIVGQTTKISASIDRVVKQDLNRGRLRLACAAVDWKSREYRCAVAPAGEQHKTLILAFDGEAWRRLDMRLHIGDICTTQDWRKYQLFIGHPLEVIQVSQEYGHPANNDVPPGTITVITEGRLRNEVYVMDHEVLDWAPPDRPVLYKSGWLRGDPEGLTPLRIRRMYIGFVDSWEGNATIRFFRNGSWKVQQESEMRLLGVDNGTGVAKEVMGKAIIGTSKVHDPRLVWRSIAIDMKDCYTWAFEIEAEYPTRVHLLAFAFDIAIATKGSPLSDRVPRGLDED